MALSDYNFGTNKLKKYHQKFANKNSQKNSK